MVWSTSWLFHAIVTASLAIGTACSQPSGHEAITRDVCIIGGGASGTYAAVRLQDLGFSVTLIEQDDSLGGMVNTYTDPDGDIPIDYGVADYRSNISVVESFLKRLDIAYGPSESTEGTTVRANLDTGQRVLNYTSPNALDALTRYGEVAAKYSELEHGYYLPEPVPEDLLMPFGQFIEKYNVSGVIHVVYRSYGDILHQPTLYVMKYFGANAIYNLFNGFIGTKSQNNSEIYDKAARVLSGNVMLHSHVVSTNMTADGDGLIEIRVQSPLGLEIIRARKLVITIPPLISNLDGFDLGNSEKTLFGQFQSVGYYTSLVQNTGLPANTAVLNTNSNNLYDLPTLPSVYQIVPTKGTGLYQVEYGSPSPQPIESVKSDILASIRRLKTTGIANVTEDGEPQFVAFASHTPFQLTVPADAIKSGFYSKLYALQGQKQTFYTGAAFHAYDSSLLWRFTEDLLPKISSGLN
ncbi:FAD dependent oxidoreductase family protein [Lophium mytilinum]|uniref:FAD dependent oxidoreductase family protein n=1 Tax=Lophium mytilinum TaxID=390894 RepID=A0A6A6RCF1_9PEZI|nr:FAD dependent oxidoreductase family protein [Lophium mytilinum]